MFLHDIQINGYCSRADPKQRKLLEENYGKHDEEKVSRVKELFVILQLEAAFRNYEEESYAEIQVFETFDFPFLLPWRSVSYF